MGHQRFARLRGSRGAVEELQSDHRIHAVEDRERVWQLFARSIRVGAVADGVARYASSSSRGAEAVDGVGRAETPSQQNALM